MTAASSEIDSTQSHAPTSKRKPPSGSKVRAKKPPAVRNVARNTLRFRDRVVGTASIRAPIASSLTRRFSARACSSASVRSVKFARGTTSARCSCYSIDSPSEQVCRPDPLADRTSGEFPLIASDRRENRTTLQRRIRAPPRQEDQRWLSSSHQARSSKRRLSPYDRIPPPPTRVGAAKAVSKGLRTDP
jgi:hypothetical protein